MLKRNIFLDKKIIQYKKFYKKRLTEKLLASFRENHFLKPIARLSFFIKKDYFCQHKQFYRSQSKSYCFMTHSKRVPTSKLQLSRFYLGKSLDRLTLTNYQK